MLLPQNMGCLLFLSLEPNILSMYTLDYPPQRINRNYVDSILDTTTVPIIDQDSPDLGILLILGMTA